MKYIILRGCPGSGKSTWAKKFIEENKGFIRINRDDIRRTLCPSDKYPGYIKSDKTEKVVTKHIEELVENLSKQAANIIDDNTNLNKKYFDNTINKVVALGYNVEIKDFFDIPLDKLLDRNIRREHSVPDDIIYKMYDCQVEIQARKIVPKEGLPSCILVDIDGTIADMGKGEPWGRSPYEYDKVSQDRPRPNVVSFVKQLICNKLARHKSPMVIFLSGRDGSCYEATKEWIYQHVFPGLCNRNDVVLYMRSPDDKRNDAIIKEELIRKYILPRYNIDFCIDDRRQVTIEYRALGLEVWQVQNGLY